MKSGKWRVENARTIGQLSFRGSRQIATLVYGVVKFTLIHFRGRFKVFTYINQKKDVKMPFSKNILTLNHELKQRG